ncbi:MAG: hypothetical protein OHK0056_22800 [Bacteriovoracaceae bacterium]
MSKSFIFLLLFSSIQAYAQTRMSALVSEVQQKLANGNTKYPIIVFDKDEVEWRYLKQDAFGESKDKENLRKKIIQEYVFEKTKVQLTDNDAGNFEPYTTVLKDSAVALPLTESYLGPYKICGVFPADPNSNQFLETERILGLGLEEAYGKIGVDQITAKLSYEELALFSIYHEVGHCLDQVFMPKTYGMYEDSHTIHQSESFAETFALLTLAREGRTNLGKRRALIRTIYSQKIGKFLATHPGNSFGNPHYVYGGIIYYLAPVIEEGQKLIDSSLEEIKKASTLELLAMAKTIVEEKSLHPRVFQGLYRVLVEKPEEVLEQYRIYTEQMPRIFGNSYQQLKFYLAKIEQDMKIGIDENLPNQVRVDRPMDLNQDQLCQSVAANDRDLFTALIEEQRIDLLNNTLIVESSQREKRNTLKSIYQILAKECD